MEITVAICTHNGELRLPKVLDCLATQANTEAIEWEVLIVDNASQDRTQDIVLNYQKKWAGNCSLRYIQESRQGLAFARAKAIEKARGHLVAFVDDDNLLTSHWIAAAHEFGQKHPFAGSYGGQVLGKFEIEPPAYFEYIRTFLAIVERGNTAYQYDSNKRMLPPGAGLVVRRKAWVENVPKQLSLTGRGKNSFLAGEDLEAVAYIQKAGWEVWYNPEMVLYHDIPKHRLEKSYLMRIAWGTGLSRHNIRMVRYNLFEKIIFIPLHLIHDFKELLSYFVSDQFKLKDTSHRRFEVTYRLGTFLSPFYSLKRQLLK